ncbi:hypothetical protein [Qingshengfaniella alkalisoli]|uniref:Uncharacterized protein n=1 Tax=Qingshengfaniella alkalisoli TaxID=2599296 RepID=A0A5B8IST7_9RHOB|nr:hypothetical protein [Qingshengfaniella alkalisoli]QDY68493.1 hypothetical protein FPZ52_01895 [Qingshengfaniella alkalisoli]
MTTRLFKILAIAALVLSILLPRVGAALASTGLFGARMVVICTGEGLETILISEDGTPVQANAKFDKCAFLHVADTAIAPVSEYVQWRPLERRYPFTRSQWIDSEAAGPAWARGPPL